MTKEEHEQRLRHLKIDIRKKSIEELENFYFYLKHKRADAVNIYHVGDNISGKFTEIMEVVFNEIINRSILGQTTKELIPIDTEYKGYFFRSRLEARWAVFFEKMGWNWQYEVEGFKLPSGNYLPDFYFPDLKMYAEVKPKELSRKELNLCKELSLILSKGEDHFNFLLLEGEPSEKCYRTLSKGDISLDVVPMPIGTKYYPFFWTSDFSKQFMDETYDCIVKARSARFEFEWKEK